MDFIDELRNKLKAPESGIGNPRFELEDTPSGKVSGFIVSPTFEDMPQLDRQNLVWNYLDRVFAPDRLLNIVVLVTITPQEAKRD